MTQCNSDMLLDYVNDALSHDERLSVLKHISGCPACRDELRELLEMKHIARSSRPELSKEVCARAFSLIPEGKTPQHGGIIHFALSPVVNAVSPVTDALAILEKTVKLVVSII